MIRTYVVLHDTGFAPNPYGAALTLACCKPQIRRHSRVRDWVLGTVPTRYGSKNVCFAGQVSECLTFGQYYSDPRFADKRPTSANSGDAIYRLGEDGQLIQVRNRYHGAGEIEHDTNVDRVLICDTFWYFGDVDVRLPDDLARCLIKRGPSHRNCADLNIERDLEAFLRNYPPGMLGRPRMPL